MNHVVEQGGAAPRPGGGSGPGRRCLVVADGPASFGRALEQIPSHMLDGGQVTLAAVVPRPSLWLVWAPVCPREARREAVAAAAEQARAVAASMPQNTATRHLVLLSQRRGAIRQLAQREGSEVVVTVLERRRAAWWPIARKVGADPRERRGPAPTPRGAVR